MQSALLLVRHYPPAISGGARRPFLLARALRELGVEVRVCAPSLDKGEPGWAVKHPNRDPSSSPLAKPGLRDRARELLLWPDPDIRWSMRAARVVLKSGWRPDWVITSSPPESLHVAGGWLAKRIGAHWAADMRDLWLTDPHRRQRRSLHRRAGERVIARRLLRRADLVTAVDPVVAAEAASLGARNPKVLAHFTADTIPPGIRLGDSGIHVIHAGSVELSDPEAKIEDLLTPFEVAHREKPELVLDLVGRLSDREQEVVRASPARESVKLHGPLPYEQALAVMAGADALAFVASHKMHVPPSKIVDYIACGRPIIACGAGPWRSDPRTPPGDPVINMLQIVPSAAPSPQIAPRAQDAARYFLSLINEVEVTKNVRHAPVAGPV